MVIYIAFRFLIYQKLTALEQTYLESGRLDLDSKSISIMVIPWIQMFDMEYLVFKVKDVAYILGIWFCWQFPLGSGVYLQSEDTSVQCCSLASGQSSDFPSASKLNIEDPSEIEFYKNPAKLKKEAMLIIYSVCHYIYCLYIYICYIYI